MLMGQGKELSAICISYRTYRSLQRREVGAGQGGGGGIFHLLYTENLFLCTFYTVFKQTFHENFL